MQTTQHWIPDDLTLTGSRIELRPLSVADIDELLIAGAHPGIWEFLPVENSDAARRAWYESSLDAKALGRQMPFTIRNRRGAIIGSTRLGEIEPEHRKLEIGWTWYKKELWGSGYNEECKYLLLSYCFEVLDAVRVQLKAHEKNIRSRRAILRLGCVFEGVLRNHVIRLGVTRNTAMFSMLPEEWLQSRSALRAIFEQKYAGTWSPDY